MESLVGILVRPQCYECRAVIISKLSGVDCNQSDLIRWAVLRGDSSYYHTPPVKMID